MASTEEILTIDWDSRTITIPSTITNIGVEHDKDSNRLYFQCPATYGEFDVSTYNIRVAFGNYNSSNTEVAADFYEVDDAVSDGENITFSWLVGANAYQSKGSVQFIVCCKYVDSDGNTVSDLNTTLASLIVLPGRECDAGEAMEQNYYDLYLKLVALVNTAENAAEATTAAQEAAEAANEAAAAANAAAQQVADLTAGLNAVVDDETSIEYTIGVENGVLYIDDGED